MMDRSLPMPGPREAIIGVSRAGVCGTDVAIYRGDYNVTLPLVLGHEFVGRVMAVGDGVDGALVGQRITADINNTCIARGDTPPCALCSRGLDKHCTRRTVTGIVGHDGAFQQFMCVPAGTLHPVPDVIPDDAAVLVEPLAAAFRVFEVSDLPASASVLVLGPGRLGILILRVAVHLGLRTAALSRSRTKRERARASGAHLVLAPNQDRLRETLREWASGSADGHGPDMVIDATGDPESLNVALQLVRPRGIVALKTTCGRPTPFDATLAVVNEVQVQGSRCGDHARAIDALSSGAVKVDDLVTAAFPMHAVEAALKAAAGGAKVVIEIGS
jgi:2-desacetyl-2-hydroxyethyl bacteriochlorophyllide A dehydrogenase